MWSDKDGLPYENDHELPEQKLWRAVIATTVDEWLHGPLARQREAERFLFLDNQDFRTVCYSAGIDPSHFRIRLEKVRAIEGRGCTLGRRAVIARRRAHHEVESSLEFCSQGQSGTLGP
jgi:hypothetical protein